MFKVIFYKLQLRTGHKERHVKSKMTTLYAVLVAVSLVPLVASVSLFDCNNPGEDACVNGGKCHYFGYCDCPRHFTGHNCGLDIVTVTPGANCSVTCHNGGTCYDGNKCHCDYNYVGKFCEKPRTGVLCKKDSMVLVAYRNPGFKGETYVWDKPHACRFVHHMPHKDVPGMNVFIRPVSLDPLPVHCTPRRSVDPVTGDITYSLDVLSLYHFSEYGSRDKVTTHSCVYKAKKPGVSIDVTDSKYLGKISVIDPLTGDPLQVLEENKPIALEFASTINDAKGVMVDYLEIYSINRNMEVRSKKIIEHGCVNPAAEATLGPIKNYSEHKAGRFVGKVQLKSFILFQNEPLLFNYRLSYCPDQCAPPTCTHATPKVAV